MKCFWFCFHYFYLGKQYRIIITVETMFLEINQPIQTLKVCNEPWPGGSVCWSVVQCTRRLPV